MTAGDRTEYSLHPAKQCDPDLLDRGTSREHGTAAPLTTSLIRRRVSPAPHTVSASGEQDGRGAAALQRYDAHSEPMMTGDGMQGPSHVAFEKVDSVCGGGGPRWISTVGEPGERPATLKSASGHNSGGGGGRGIARFAGVGLRTGAPGFVKMRF